MGITRLIFFPNKTKKSRKTGKIPIYLRVLHNSLKAESRLNAEIEENELLLWNERAMCFEQRSNRINDRIRSIQTEFNKLEASNNYKLASYSAKEIIENLLGSSKQEKMVDVFATDYLNKYFSDHVLHNNSFAYNTVKTYRKAVNHFNNFVKIKNLQKITLEKFDHEKAQEFKTYLTSDYPPLLKKGMTEVSASSVICKLKVIFANAEDSDLIKKNPFLKIKLTSQSPPKPKLTIEEIASISNLDLTEFPSLEIYRDIFLFTCFTGLSYNEVGRLTRNVISQTKAGLKFESFRGKTKIPVDQFLVSRAEEIFNKYKDHPQVKIKNTLVPPRSMTQVNIHIKIIAEMCKIKKKLSTSIARCTCRQLLSEAGVKEPLVIHSIMGWSSVKNIDSKYYSITESRLIDAKQVFEVYLNKYLNKCSQSKNLNSTKNFGIKSLN